MNNPKTLSQGESKIKIPKIQNEQGLKFILDKLEVYMV